MKKLAPGVYDDERGGLHIDMAELLTANGYADTTANRAMLEQVWQEWGNAHRTPVEIKVHPSITCPTCGRTSYHPRDIAERYCGNCHCFY